MDRLTGIYERAITSAAPHLEKAAEILYRLEPKDVIGMCQPSRAGSLVHPSRVLWAELANCQAEMVLATPTDDWDTAAEFVARLNGEKGFGHSSMPFVNELREQNIAESVTDQLVDAVSPLVAEAADDPNLTNITGVRMLCEWAGHICVGTRAMRTTAQECGFELLLQ